MCKVEVGGGTLKSQSEASTIMYVALCLQEPRIAPQSFNTITFES